jgi:hypothetical protein
MGFDSGDNPNENPPADPTNNASLLGSDSVSVERCAVYPSETIGKPTGSIIETGAPSFEVNTIVEVCANCVINEGL